MRVFLSTTILFLGLFATACGSEADEPTLSRETTVPPTSSTTTTGAEQETFASEPDPGACDQSLSFLGDVDDPGSRGAFPESVLDIRSASEITVLGSITGVEPGPTFAWVPERIEVPDDDSRAQIQMLHFTLDIDRAHPSSVDIGQSMQFAIAFAPLTDHQAVEASATSACDIVVFLLNGPATNYDSGVWSTTLDGGAIGVVNGGHVEFPNAFDFVEALTIEVEELFGTS